ncbi:MAG: hypothetical protein F4Z04_00435 [Acidobacteria bacterium]|nr:hypothetical protein [Acidobacteriota bacterium]
MRLYVEPMDAVLVEFDFDGRVRFDGEDWSTPSLQETRAILYAAEGERAALEELTDALEGVMTSSDSPRRAPESRD